MKNLCCGKNQLEDIGMAEPANSLLFESPKKSYQIDTKPAEIHDNTLQQNAFRAMNANAPSGASDQLQQNEQKALDETSVLKQDYARELLREISLLADDRGKASDFFQPVVDHARLLMRGNISEEKNASVLAELLYSVKHYLVNRGSSLFSRQRNRRRASCQRLLDKAKAFYATAPYVYSLYLEHTLCIEKKADPASKEVKGLLQDYSFLISEENINARVAEEKLSTLPKEKKPKEVQRILDLLEGLHSIMNDPMPVHPGKEASKQELDHYNEEVFNSNLAVTRVYDLVIESCNSFLSLKGNDKLIVSQVQSIKKSVQHTRKVFSNSITTFLSGHIPDGSTTWAEAIASKHAAIYDISSEDTAILGDGTSIVYQINQEEDNTKYFKKDEKTATNPVEAWQRVLDNIPNMKDYKPEYKNRLKKYVDGMKKALSEYEKARKGNDRERMEEEERILYDRFVIGGLKGGKNHLANYYNNRRARREDPFITELARVDANTSFGRFLNNVIGDFIKTFNVYYFGGAAGITPGGVMADRNVATSRMASLMGINHLVTRSETADVMQNNKMVSGVLMEGAKGEEASGIYTEKYEGVRYEDQTVVDLMTMHVFDIICGQIDRNTNNFFLTLEGNKISGLQMIDNDMSFGLASGKALTKRKYYQLPAVDPALLIALPASIKLKIHELATAPESYYRLVFGDLLSVEEISYLMNRVNHVDNMIKKEQDKQKGNAEDKALEKKLSDSEFAALYYQKMLWKHAEDEARKNDEDFDQLDAEEQHQKMRRYVINHSYLSTEYILTPQEIEERLSKKELPD